MKRILVTGSAGFIGFHLVKALLTEPCHVVGIDNLNDYYDTELKHSRLEALKRIYDENSSSGSYHFYKCDISKSVDLNNIFREFNFDIVVHLAAQAGVRYSIENPQAYVESNLIGFTNILECCRQSKLDHFIFASSSSVYGMSKNQKFSTKDNTDFPVSLYAATKKANEVIAHSYSHLYEIPTTGLRFFTVYGPFGRPDMAYYKFAESIARGSPIEVFNHGEMLRDFTYIDDVVDALLKLLPKTPSSDPSGSSYSNAPFKLYNVGNNNPVSLRRFITAIEDALERKAIEKHLPMQPGDVPSTYADIKELSSLVGFKPTTSIEQGISKFVAWHTAFKKQ